MSQPLETLRRAIQAQANDPHGGKVLLPADAARDLLHLADRQDAAQVETDDDGDIEYSFVNLGPHRPDSALPAYLFEAGVTATLLALARSHGMRSATIVLDGPRPPASAEG